jgi:hypothetical protein
MKKSLTYLLITIFCIIYFVGNCLIPTNAEEIINNENCFSATISSSSYYKEYESEIKEKVVDRTSQTDDGEKRTVSYSLAPDKNTSRALVFIGNESNEIIDVLLILDGEDSLQAIDLIDYTNTKIHYGTARERVYQCEKSVCTAFSYQASIDYNDSGCSLFVGQSCNVASLFGHPILAILCKGGVWIACHTSVDKVCTQYYTYLDVCSL